MREDFQYDLSMVIVNSRAPTFVKERLATFQPELKGMNAGVMVVDNHSGGGSADNIDRLLREYDADGVVRLMGSTDKFSFPAGWLETAPRVLCEHPDAVVVCGRCRERYPQRSIYNALCDIEWDSPIGDVRACGGDAMMRASAFRAVDGFRPDMIAGEEPELCVRLRAAGGRIWRLGEEMTLHDAAMTRFGQWWQRSKRAGYAFALGAYLHGHPPERHYVRHARRALFWGIALPALTVLLSVFETRFIGLAVLYPLKVLRIGLSDNHNAVPWRRAMFLVLGHFPEGLGLVKFFINKAFNKKAFLIEYQ